MPGLFQRFCHHPLVLGAGAGAVVAQNFGVRGHKAAQGLRVFVVHSADFVRAKIALLFNLWLAVSVVIGWAHRSN